MIRWATCKGVQTMRWLIAVFGYKFSKLEYIVPSMMDEWAERHIDTDDELLILSK